MEANSSTCNRNRFTTQYHYLQKNLSIEKTSTYKSSCCITAPRAPPSIGRDIGHKKMTVGYALPERFADACLTFALAASVNDGGSVPGQFPSRLSVDAQKWWHVRGLRPDDRSIGDPVSGAVDLATDQQGRNHENSKHS